MVRRWSRALWFMLILSAAVAALWYYGKQQQVEIPAEAIELPVVEVPLTASPYINYQKLLDHIYENASGYRIGEEEKQTIRTEGGDPTYGEILYESAETLLKDLQLTADDVFYDLGSGAGKFVQQVYLTTPVKKAVGIELSKTRCALAQERAAQVCAIAEMGTRFDCELHCSLHGAKEQKTRVVPSKTIEFVNDNFLKADMSDATVVFMCSTCFSEGLMQQIVDKLAGLKEGLRVLTLKDLPVHKDFKLVRHYQLPMSWSRNSAGSPVYLYKLEHTQSAPVVEEVAVNDSENQENFEK